MPETETETPRKNHDNVDSNAVDASPEATTTVSSVQHFGSTMALCACVLTHSYLLISVFPYSGYMAMDLLPGVNQENAGSYAGLLASSFMIGRALSSYSWGKWADTYGRVFVLNASLILSLVLTLWFGLSTSFGMALLVRCLLGFVNGLISTAKTVVSELAGNNKQLETRAMGLVMGMRGWGFLFSPALSGALAEPVKQYPQNKWVQQFEPFLSKFPFLLPNVVGAMLCLISLFAVWAFVHETLPIGQQRPWILIPAHVATRVGDIWSKAQNKRRPARLEETLPLVPSYQNDQREQNEATIKSLWARKNTRNHLMVYWLFSFVSIGVDEAFPLFCISRKAGLGLSEMSIGNVYSGSGLVFAICQYFTFTIVVHQFGVYSAIRGGILASAPAVAIIPLSLALNQGMRLGELSWGTYLFLSIVMAIYRISISVFFSSITMATNRTVPTCHRATMNGLSMLGGSAVKGVGPAFAGILTAFCISSGFFAPHVGAVIVFALIGLLTTCVAVYSFVCLKEEGT